MNEHNERASANDGTENGAARRAETQTELDLPNLYVASLADYNAGYLHGEWMSAAQPADALFAQIEKMLAKSPLAKQGEVVEEWAIHDYENFGGVRIGEYADLDTVTEIARGIVEHGPAYAAWYEQNDGSTPEQFEEAYIGEFASLVAYAESLGDDFGWEDILNEAVPPSLRPYVNLNYHQLANDLQFNSEVYTADTGNGSVWIFRS